MAHGQQKKPLDFGGNPDHVTLGLGLGGGTSILSLGWMCVSQHLFNGNNSTTSVALAEVCTLRSAILVFILDFNVLVDVIIFLMYCYISVSLDLES